MELMPQEQRIMIEATTTRKKEIESKRDEEVGHNSALVGIHYIEELGLELQAPRDDILSGGLEPINWTNLVNIE